jgi:excinuclease ABC subunit C
MISQEIKKIISDLPDTPGVYLFKRGKEILYIGKATSLRDRVRSYFNPDIVYTRSPLISKMLSEFTTIDHVATDSVLEALILEAHLIKKHQPEANIKEKDNKSFNYVVITDEDFPRVLIVRGRELEKQVGTDMNVAHKFGPFPNGSQLRSALKLVRKMFPFRDTCVPAVESGKTKPCFNRQIGLCPGVCSGEISRKEYNTIIKNIILFFEGNKKKIITNLEGEMNRLSKLKQFEDADRVKRRIFSLQHIQDISLIKEDVLTTQKTPSQTTDFRIESYDIAHMSGKNMVGVMTVVENGETVPAEYRKFKIRDDNGVNDTKALSEVLSRRLAHIEWQMPQLIVVDGGLAQKNAIEKVLADNGVAIPVVSVVKDERHRAKEILGDKKWLAYERDILLSNTEAHRYALKYHDSLRFKIRK